MPERIQKIIAEAGVMSRRAAEQAIRDGRVILNGRPAALGETAEDSDSILLDGKRLPKREEKLYFMLNKPRGYVCSMRDEKGRRTVRELLPESAGRVYPVGRLDLMSEGLLLMTNDGDFAHRVMHPSGNLNKVYRTWVSGDRLGEQIARLGEPFRLDDAVVQTHGVRVLKQDGDTAVLDLTIGEGRNREIRRICEITGLKVERLVRVAEGPLRLENLPTGKFRMLTPDEVSGLMRESKR